MKPTTTTHPSLWPHMHLQVQQSDSILCAIHLRMHFTHCVICILSYLLVCISSLSCAKHATDELGRNQHSLFRFLICAKFEQFGTISLVQWILIISWCRFNYPTRDAFWVWQPGAELNYWPKASTVGALVSDKACAGVETTSDEVSTCSWCLSNRSGSRVLVWEGCCQSGRSSYRVHYDWLAKRNEGRPLKRVKKVLRDSSILE
jgi:hypothetical protein